MVVVKRPRSGETFGEGGSYITPRSPHGRWDLSPYAISPAGLPRGLWPLSPQPALRSSPLASCVCRSVLGNMVKDTEALSSRARDHVVPLHPASFLPSASQHPAGVTLDHLHLVQLLSLEQNLSFFWWFCILPVLCFLVFFRFLLFTWIIYFFLWLRFISTIGLLPAPLRCVVSSCRIYSARSRSRTACRQVSPAPPCAGR